jgi:hypothetical protein
MQFILAVRLIPILTHLSSRWTVPLKTDFHTNFKGKVEVWGRSLLCGWAHLYLSANFHTIFYVNSKKKSTEEERGKGWEGTLWLIIDI